MNDPFAKIATVYDWLHFGASRTYQKISSLADFKAEDEILDLGGGTGRIAKFFIGKARRVVVADPSTAMIGSCLKKGLECVVTSGNKLPFSDNIFDKVLIIDALHHIQEKEAVLKEVRRILKPGGNLILEEFNPKSLLGKIIVYFEKILGFGSQFLTKGELVDLLDRNGFSSEARLSRWGMVCIVVAKL